ncbi:MAG: ABC transporter permease [Dehalococcoidia bacterium]|nr:Tungstate uptake system permease protein TupB [Chloroflexota bacterium]MBT9161507.1 Tungstate uptake system permease protein TupB [Chloroflexota bacterium]
MNEITTGFLKAIELIVTLDPEVMEIAGRSLAISLTATLLASVVCIPLGGLVHFHDFTGKRILINIIQTLYSLPTVSVGLFVFLLLSRAGPLGVFGLLFTPTGMVIGQMILISPLMIGFTISALSAIGPQIKDTAISLGASNFQAILTIIKEARFAILAAVVLGFGRAISEVGIAIMIGGNIRGFTRVFTSAMALETARGDIELSMALGIILISLALVVNLLLNRIQQR